MPLSWICSPKAGKSIAELIEKPINLERPIQTKFVWERDKAHIQLGCTREGLPGTGLAKCQIDKCIDLALLDMMQQSEENARLAWGRVYWLYQKNLYICLLANGCKEEARAEDMVNNVFLDFYEDLRQKRSRQEEFKLRDASLKTFLCNIAKRRWIDYTRSGDYKRVKIDDPARESPGWSPQERVFAKLRRFVALYRRIFPNPQDNCLRLLKYAFLENMLYKEILETKLGQVYHSVGAVANRISYCKKAAFAKLQQEATLMEELKDIFGVYRINLKTNSGSHGKG